MTESQSHRHPRVLRIPVGEIFLCLISINSPYMLRSQGDKDGVININPPPDTSVFGCANTQNNSHLQEYLNLFSFLKINILSDKIKTIQGNGNRTRQSTNLFFISLSLFLSEGFYLGTFYGNLIFLRTKNFCGLKFLE